MVITEYPKAAVLAALYNNSRPLGLGFSQFSPARMSEEEAQALLDAGQTYFDYLKGKVMKVDLSKNDLDTRLYNRDNGSGAAEAAIAGIPDSRKL